MRTTTLASALVLVAGLCLSPPAAAQRQVVIYRCTDARGAVTLQNDMPCPKGSREQKQTIVAPPAMPAYEPRIERMPRIVTAEEKRETAQIKAALPDPVPVEERKPPPALYQCSTWEQDKYYTQDAEPAQRCVPMRVVGLNGRPGTGAARACATVTDTCTPVPEAQLCEAWQRRVDEARFRWNFAGSDDRARESEYRKLANTLRNSTCTQ